MQSTCCLIEDGNVFVPDVWYLEVANVIARAKSKFGLTEARCSTFLHALQQMNIQVDRETARHALGDTL